MTHALLYVLFGFSAAAWLRFELKRNFPLSSHGGWVAAAAGFGLLGALLTWIYGGVAGNFLLHSVGGGMASVCLFYYLAKNFKLSLNWRLELAALFLFVSCLGVLNELGEYFLEMTFHTIMSIDTHDTWRDFVANSSGAFVLWTILRLAHSSKKLKQ